MTPLRILIVEPSGLNGVNWWRTHTPFAQLLRNYPGFYQVQRYDKRVTNEDLMYADLVYLSRPCTKTDVKVIQRAKEFGCHVLLDFDDDILNLPIGHTLLMDFAEFAPDIRECMALADWIWTSTETIRYVADALPRSQVIKNAVLPSQIEKATFSPWTRTAAWRGTHAQFHDLYDQRQFFRDNHHKADQWLWLGYIPPFDEIQQTVFQGQRWTQDTAGYIMGLHKLKCNWLWKPMKPCQFNDAKSNIAWIEATISGAICVTNYAGKPQWELATDEMIEDERLACELWSDSKAFILREHNLITENAKRHECLQRIASQRHDHKPRLLSAG